MINKKYLNCGFAPLIILVFFLVLAVGLGIFYIGKAGKDKVLNFDIMSGFRNEPKCPANLSGVLTYPLIDLNGVAAIWPLGNVSPPGHTSPSDHNYFDGVSDEKVAVYAPVDGWITNITAILQKDENTGKYNPRGITIDIDICQGLTLTFANLTEAGKILKDGWPKSGNGCKYDIVKDGHNYTEGQCYFHSNIKVKAGDLLGYTSTDPTKPESIGLQFEIWAANYNKSPDSNVDWEYYQDERRAHIMCTFDLYGKPLKDQFYAKLGRADVKTRQFVARTVAPLCGTVNQDVPGTIQGMWFSGKPQGRDDSVEFRYGGLAFLHANFDGTTGEISIGGDLNNKKADVVFFNPTHSGLISREPSEIKADGQIYCYDATRDEGTKRFLVQLTGDHQLKAEIQTGMCDGNYSFIKPFNYER